MHRVRNLSLLVANFKNGQDVVTENEFEKKLLAEVIPPGDIGVSFDDIGALENVKDTLKELVMLPLQRPNLFAKGQLTKVSSCIISFRSRIFILIYELNMFFLNIIITCAALQGHLAIWTSWYRKNDACKGCSHRGRCQLYQYIYVKHHLKGTYSISSSFFHFNSISV